MRFLIDEIKNTLTIIGIIGALILATVLVVLMHYSVNCFFEGLIFKGIVSGGSFLIILGFLITGLEREM